IVNQFASLAKYGVPLDEINRYTENVQAVKAADVEACAASRLNTASSSVVIVGNAKYFLPDLKKRFPDVEVIPVGELDLNSASLRKKLLAFSVVLCGEISNHRGHRG